MKQIIEILQRDIEYDRGYASIPPTEPVQDTGKEQMERSLKDINEIMDKLKYGLWVLGYQNNSHDMLMKVTSIAQELQQIAIQAVKDKYKE